MADRRQLPRQRATLAFLIFSHIAACCVSLIYCADFHFPGSPFDPKLFHIFYDPAKLYDAVNVVGAFAVVSLAFLFVRFSFGFFVGFYLYMMVLGYLWLNCFSDLNYDHRFAGASAAASAVAFLWPALFMSSPAQQIYTLSPRALDRLLRFSLVFAAAVIILGASYNYRLVTLDRIYDYRDRLESPKIVNYLIGMTSNSLLPFAFACFVTRNDRLRASAVLILLLLFYPITLSKLTFFTPVWLCFVALLSKVFEVRISVVLSLFVPILTGIIIFVLFKAQSEPYFGTINFRMIAIPSVAMDVYSDFFSKHDLTYYCQVSALKPLIYCPYQEPLAIVMKKAYELGNFNASLFATEGIASVGPWLAPLAVFICGLIVALGNRVSAGLPPRFILISGAIFPQVLLNVPLTIALLTHGAAVLFLLWYVTPRTIFEQEACKSIARER